MLIINHYLRNPIPQNNMRVCLYMCMRACDVCICMYVCMCINRHVEGFFF